MTTQTRFANLSGAMPPEERPKPSVQEVFAQDSRPAPDVLRFESPPEGLGSDDISVERYFDQAWHDREMETVWRKRWQMAARVEELQKPGDHVVYEIGDESLIVVRTESNEIRAFVNVCLHRGVLLRKEGGCVQRFKCPFHGFAWKLDGRLDHIPSGWDFEHVDPDKFSLPEVKVGTWGGFVFVNLDPDCEPLESYLEILPEHFERFRLEDRWKAGHVCKVLPCNWKLALEAFIESFHIPVAHPQTTTYVAWDTTQYDIFPGVRHVNRMITLEALASPTTTMPGVEKTIRHMQRDVAFHAQADVAPTEPFDVRNKFADNARHKLTRAARRDLSDMSNAEVVDVIQYFLFPNLVPWGGHGVPICYRFRPYRNDPERCVMEIMLLFAKAEDGSHPPPPAPRWLTEEQSWSDAPELGSAGFVADQDTENLRRIQRGLRATHKPGITLANYQESRIRHFHQTLDSYMGEKG
jgi:phenylpropionate dioxygenase-like ring-hydroxylating dioxygenase large terminal subunit